MKAYRIYYVDSRYHDVPTKVYECNRPGYWMHHCEDPEYAVPFLSKEVAERSVKFSEQYVAPPGKRYVEEYEETRPLVANKSNGDVTFAKFMPYYHDRYMYRPA